MSEEAHAGQQPRHLQADELIDVMRKCSIATSALAAAVVALTIAVEKNTSAIEDFIGEVDEVEHDEDCEDDDCDGECLDDPPPKKRRKKR